MANAVTTPAPALNEVIRYRSAGQTYVARILEIGTHASGPVYTVNRGGLPVDIRASLVVEVLRD